MSGDYGREQGFSATALRGITGNSTTGFHESPVWTSLATVGVVTIAAFLATTALLARGWRLKP
jgi:hypothetical protein